MKQVLQEIIELLQGDLPQLASSLNPPATEEDLCKAEAQLGFGLPSELRELYLIHNGEKDGGPGLFFGLPFLSLDNMLAESRIWIDLEDDTIEVEHYSVPADWIKEQYINRYWVPISKDWGGNNLGIDLDPADKGIKGQVINFGRDEEVKYVIALSVSHLLQFIRDTAKEGNYSINREDDAYISWSFGKEGEVHFLDAIRSMKLPVLELHREESGVQDVNIWFEGLDNAWKERIMGTSGSPDAFLRAKQLLFIGKGLTDITPLGQCGDVRELVLSVNEICSIEALSGCKQLKILYLVKNPVSDLRPLQSLEHLQELIISGTAVTDISPLSLLPKLKVVNVQHTQIRDFSPLETVKSLRALEISAPDAQQLRSIAELKQLKELTISGLDQITEGDLAVLGKLVNLRKLELEGVSLLNMQFVKKCHKLREVIIKDSVVEDISLLAKLEKLQSLELSGCPNIGKLEDLACSASLSKITASFQQFTLLKESFDRAIDFSTITGGMTEEESGIWHEYLDRVRGKY
ncbi:leucine-rich repeat domain-containing protein [Paenibacillus eucommiae]|uniref:Cell wall assembly regulator SMI1/Leucine-rich repeat (LRR) protein n=1 Tax=Paenibacillus eucommiae TaxID=1355755 RepID=A0ABS4IPZ1_9BACL|nr:leucine-rich repeat domain-containing protein [Paenibacillus eucommiae]MBP1989633.1 cell wall assembly regulator SMI1/Leucine-rich repeat (LRR) protein [Paenibacillus eucommiae]